MYSQRIVISFGVVRLFAPIGEVTRLGHPAGLHVIASLGDPRALRYMMGEVPGIL
jgi:hypothetical protein